MKVYIAGSFAYKSAIGQLAHFLSLNVPEIEFTSSWLNTELKESDLDRLNSQACIDEDLADIERADILLLINTPDLSTTSPGRWVESGIALATGKLMVVYGSFQESMFLRDQSVIQLPTDSRTELVMTLNAVGVTLKSLSLESMYGDRENQRRVAAGLREGTAPGPAQNRGQDPRQGIQRGEGRSLHDLDRAVEQRASRTGGLKDPTRG